MLTLTSEEAQQVLEHLDDLVEAQQWEIDMHITQYGEEYKPHRVKHMRERLASTNGTIEILRARLSAPEPEPVGWIYEDDEGRMMFSQMPQNPPLWEPVYKAKREKNT